MAFLDLFYYRVSNILICGGLLVSFTYQTFVYSFEGLFLWGTKIIVPIFCLYALYWLGVVGGGDIKLLAMIFTYLDIDLFMKSILTALIMSAVWSVFRLFSKKQIISRLLYFQEYYIQLKTSKKWVRYYSGRRDERDAVIPLGCCIAAGTVLQVICSVLGR